MARSSRKKSSSSSYKKKKKRSQHHKKKRSSRDKSKKRLPRYDSSSDSEEDSTFTSSMSYSSSDDDYRSKRKARSRDKRDVKVRKKRVKRRISTSQSSEDSRHIRERKRSKRDRDSDGRRKHLEKKKRKREPSVSSLSSRSKSVSTCEPSESSGREYDRDEGRLVRKDKDKRAMGKDRSESKSRRHGSRSCSPRSLNSNRGGYLSEERVTYENTSRRLKSVITVAQGRDETEGGLDPDGQKDEICYDHDEYPPSRSNDSIDGESRREVVHNSISEKTRSFEDVNDIDVASDIWATKVSERGNVSSNNMKDNKGEASTAKSGINGYDLEAILRQKALENLRKRQVDHLRIMKTPSDKKDKADGEVKPLSMVDTESHVGSFSKEGNIRLMPKDEKAVNGKENISGSSKQNDVSSPSRNSSLVSPKALESDPATVTDKSRPEKSTSRADSTGTEKTLKPHMSMDEASAMGSQSVYFDAKTSAELVDKNAASEASNSVNHDSTGPQNEGNEGSQFEQKTMSVMRGGEMVQVSYKVYIPKKAPALARRQLKR